MSGQSFTAKDAEAAKKSLDTKDMNQSRLPGAVDRTRRKTKTSVNRQGAKTPKNEGGNPPCPPFPSDFLLMFQVA